MNMNVNCTLGDKETLTDFLTTQKQITSTYNTWAGECVNTSLREKMLAILDDEHCIQNDIFTEMSSHGWYPVQPAQQMQIDKVKQKFSK